MKKCLPEKCFKKYIYFPLFLSSFIVFGAAGCMSGATGIGGKKSLGIQDENLKQKREKRLALRHMQKQGAVEGKKTIELDLHNGVEDLLITGPFESDAKETSFFTFSGSVSTYSKRGSEFGSSLAIGDINGDGFSELIVGSPNIYSRPKTKAKNGRVHLLSGREKFQDILTDQDYALFTSKIWDGAIVDNLGKSLAVFDYNGDGKKDVAVGAPLFVNPSTKVQTGAVFIFWGNRESTEVTGWQHRAPDVSFFGSEEGGFFGDEIASGDLNGDGKQDLIVGAPGLKGIPEGNQDAGAVYVFYGKNSFQETVQTSETFDLRLNGLRGGKEKKFGFQSDHMGDSTGFSLALCDVNGDSIDDLLIGAPGFDSKDALDSGGVYLMHGKKERRGVFNLKDQSDLFFVGSVPFGNAGFEVACLERRNEKPSMIIISTPFTVDSDPNTISGSVFVLNGTSSKDTIILNSSSSLVLKGRSPEAKGVLFLNKRGVYYFGSALAVGDFNGDGSADLAIGAPGTTAKGVPNRQNAGEVFIVFGPFMDSGYQLISDASDIIIYGDSEKSLAGSSLVAGDLNGDKIDDLIIGAPGSKGESGNVYNSGEVYVFYGKKGKL